VLISLDFTVIDSPVMWRSMLKWIIFGLYHIKKNEKSVWYEWQKYSYTNFQMVLDYFMYRYTVSAFLPALSFSPASRSLTDRLLP
jgi:hypothetical protein